MRIDTAITMTALAALAALGACATTGRDAPPRASICNPRAAAALVGQVAPDDADILRRTHSMVIRRIAPGDPVTEDLRQDRVTVTVAEGRIVAASCG